MYIKRYLSPSLIYFFSWRLVIWSLCTGSVAYTAYDYMEWKWVAIPWLPVSLIGTAVAFYVGFKNNQAYDRSWEARKVWGGIVNTSRSFAASVRAYVTNEYANEPVSEGEIRSEIKTILYRHIGWTYALKHAMWHRTTWEHQVPASRRQRDYFRRRMNLHSVEESLARYLSKEEQEWISKKKNMATQLLDKQSQHLTALKRKGLLDNFRHVELQRLITELYGEQGRTERIKNTPLPRQYATTSAIFIVIFTFLLPFGMLTEFAKLGEGMMWLVIPFNLVVSWVFSLMEYIGDYSENPFEGLVNDTPIYSIVRNIEIDLKDMMDEEELPERIQPVYDTLF